MVSQPSTSPTSDSPQAGIAPAIAAHDGRRSTPDSDSGNVDVSHDAVAIPIDTNSSTSR